MPDASEHGFLPRKPVKCIVLSDIFAFCTHYNTLHPTNNSNALLVNYELLVGLLFRGAGAGASAAAAACALLLLALLLHALVLLLGLYCQLLLILLLLSLVLLPSVVTASFFSSLRCLRCFLCYSPFPPLFLSFTN